MPHQPFAEDVLWPWPPTDVPWMPPPPLTSPLTDRRPLYTPEDAQHRWPHPTDVRLPSLFPMPPPHLYEWMPLQPPVFIPMAPPGCSSTARGEEEDRTNSDAGSSECSLCRAERSQAPLHGRPSEATHGDVASKTTSPPLRGRVLNSTAPRSANGDPPTVNGKRFTSAAERYVPERHPIPPPALTVRQREARRLQRRLQKPEQSPPVATTVPTAGPPAAAQERGKPLSERTAATVQQIDALYHQLRSTYHQYENRDSVDLVPSSRRWGEGGGQRPVPTSEEPHTVSREEQTESNAATGPRPTGPPRPTPSVLAESLLEPSRELREELLRLESTYQRLRELQAMSQHDRPPTSAPSAPREAVATPPFTNEEVMKIIRQRRDAVGAS